MTKSTAAGRQARATGRKAANSRTVSLLARLGLAARGVVYLLIGILSVQVAFGGGGGGEQADRGGALQAIADQPLGLAVLWILAVGFAGLTLWKVTEALWGGEKLIDRLLDAGRTVIYVAGCYAVVRFVVGAGSSSSDQQSRALTTEVMKFPGGAVLIGAVGATVVITGVVFIIRTFMKKFEDELKITEMSPTTHRVMRVLGIVGHTARGLVFGTVGVFLVQAAVTFDPDKAKGLDKTLKSLTETPAGPWPLVLIALGVCVFAVFCVCEARWQRT